MEVTTAVAAGSSGIQCEEHRIAAVTERGEKGAADHARPHLFSQCGFGRTICLENLLSIVRQIISRGGKGGWGYVILSARTINREGAEPTK